LILVTNDDGIRSPGLHAAAEAVAHLGELLIVAPATQQTSMSRAFARDPLGGSVEPTEMLINGEPITAYAVVGSPVQAVAHGMLEIADRLPALCVSGINYGENIGGGIPVSGTIGAALEAEGYGIPALAASIQVAIAEWKSYGDKDWTVAKHFTGRLAEEILIDGLPPEVAALNLNVPAGATTETEVRMTVQSRQRYYRHLPPEREARHEPIQLKVHTVVDLDVLEPGSDIEAIYRDGVVSVTALAWTMTAQTSWRPRLISAPV
jgi:5'-nucleotidase